MRKLICVAVLLVTGALLTVGAYLPRLAARAQDRTVMDRIRYDPISDVQLQIREGLNGMEKLALMTKLSSNIELFRESASMSEEQVNAAAAKALEPYVAAELMEPWETWDVDWRILLVGDSADLQFNGIVWSGAIAMDSQGGSLADVIIDDETGRLLYVNYGSQRTIEDPDQALLLDRFAEIFFHGLEITDYQHFVTNDMEHAYIGDNATGVRWRFGDVVYGEINVDLYVYRYGFYMDFS